MNNKILTQLKSKEFNKFILEIAQNCINYVLNTKIKFVQNKNDGSPLTQADLYLDKIIYQGLNKITPKIKILSEETSFSSKAYLEECYWIIDPIDGTKSYVSGGEEYTVNIALIYKGQPCLGLIAHPPSNRIWYAISNELYIIKNGNKVDFINKNKYKNNFPVIITSKEINLEMENFLNNFKNFNIMKLSSSLKFCKLAENKAHFYPRFSNINKWDIAAGHAILNASGGIVINLSGNELNYNSLTSKTGKFIALSEKKLIKSFNVLGL